MILLRSTLFNLYFFGVTGALSLFGVGVRLFARHRALDLARFWARLCIAGARRICGIELVVSGGENLPQGGAALIAPQHQSAFDTVVWLTLLPFPAYVVKRELIRVPLFGSLMVASGMIPLDRGAGAGALRVLLRGSAQALAEGRQVVIFPEGTRVNPGEVGPLLPGIAAIASRSGLPVIPVATDSGRRWARRAFRKYPGPIHIVVLPPIPAGLPREALMTRLETTLREASGAIAEWG